MKPINIRNESFADIQARMAGDRERVYEALQTRLDCTTRELAEAMGWDILNVRPRVTELVDLEAVEIVGSRGHEGVYRARPFWAWEAAFARRKMAATTGEQLTLGF